MEYLVELLQHEDIYESEQLVLSVDGLSCMVEDELCLDPAVIVSDDDKMEYTVSFSD